MHLGATSKVVFVSFRTSLIGVVDSVRSITGPSGLDIRLNQLTITVRTWSGARCRQGTATDVSITLPKKFPIRELVSKEIAASGGEYQMGDIIVDHITPTNGAGVGYTPTQLKPIITDNNQERIYQIVGDQSAVAGEYALVELRSFRPFTWQLVLRRRLTTP